MGWRGSVSEIDFGMLFKKMYCKNCGERLKKKKNTEIIKKGDPRFSRRIGRYIMIGLTSYSMHTYTYLCPNCGLELSYDEQVKIAKIQKKLNCKILYDEEK